MFPSWNSPGPFAVNPLPDVLWEVLSDVGPLGLGRKSDRRVASRVGIDEGLLAGVPRVEELGRGRGSDEARVTDSGETDAGDVTRGRVDSL